MQLQLKIGGLKLRIAVAKYGQETNSFSLGRTTLDTFRRFGLYQGGGLLQDGMKTGPLAGLEAACRDCDFAWTPIPMIRGWGGASGIITQDTHEFFVKSICDGLDRYQRVDAVFLDLHGAAQAEHLDDCEGDVISRCRKLLGSNVPIVVALDHHANVTQEMCRNATAIVAHRTQPHDPFDTGYQAGKLLLKHLSGAVNATMEFSKIPMLTHQEQFLTGTNGPMKEWFQMARAFERQDGVLSVSPCPMQPWLDITEAGWAVIVVTDDDSKLAKSLADEMAAFAWEHRNHFMRQESVDPKTAVQMALQSEQFVVLSDTGDSVFGGAPGDSTVLLRELMQVRCEQDCLVPMVDAEVVANAYEAGVDSGIRVIVGGKLDSVFSQPVEMECEVLRLGGGTVEVEVIGNDAYDAGRSALLRSQHILLAVTETEGIGGNHPICYEQFGIDVGRAKLAVLKTASNFQYYSHFNPQIIRADTDGMTMSSVQRFPWKRLTRPIFPLDEM